MIRTERLTKKYGNFYAVKDVSLHVKQGEIYGFLGLNGAGKTTTLEMLLGLTRPTSGQAYCLNTPVTLNNFQLWEQVGYLLDAPYAYPELTVRENLSIFAKLRRLTGSKRIEQVIETLNLQPYADKKARQLSLGNRIRLSLARALLHEPKILILDEPVNGLDPAGMIDIRELLKDLAFNHGVTILMSSHLLDEVAKIATTIGIIHKGCLIEEIPAKTLKEQLREQLVIKIPDHIFAYRLLRVKGIETEILEANTLITKERAVIDQPEKIAEIFVKHKIPLKHLSVEKETLEDYFLRKIKVSETK